ncbi:hypothetical protein KAR91_09485 [Candidatus Pacearchaeota archaeon]|nr:hypothetical protein [Candidatus Pacearchaeota archaeon]
MAKRKWQVTISMGHIWTETTGEIDLVSDGFYTEEELIKVSDNDVIDQLCDDAFECAKEKIAIHVKASED